VVRDGTPVRLPTQPAAVPASTIVPAGAGAVTVSASAPR
jgi:hypothetical protein